MENLLFDGWDILLRTLIVGTLAYAGLIVMLRVSGKRTLSKMSPFDLIITFALGSILASVLTAKDIALAQGLLAFALLITLQVVISRLVARYRLLERWINSEPQLIFYNGHYLHAAMKSERVSEKEILTLVREQGRSSIDDVEAVILETNGDFSVILKSEEGADDISALKGVRGLEQAERALGRPQAHATRARQHRSRPSHDGHDS